MMEKKSLDKKQIQVIKIIDEFTVLINAGKTSGIKTDNWIIIYEEGPLILDLDEKPLGTFDFTKAKLKITKVFPDFAVAEHLKESTGFAMDKILGGGGLINNGPLPIKNEEDIANLSPKDPDISIGDLVKIL